MKKKNPDEEEMRWAIPLGHRSRQHNNSLCVLVGLVKGVCSLTGFHTSTGMCILSIQRIFQLRISIHLEEKVLSILFSCSFNYLVKVTGD